MRRIGKEIVEFKIVKRVAVMVLVSGLCLSPVSGNAATQPEILNEVDRKLDQWFRSHLVADSRVKVKVGGQSRYRFEYRDDFSLNDLTYEDDALNLLRNRLNLDVAYLSDTGATPLRFFVEGQEAHAFTESDVNQNTFFVNELDLRQAFAELKSPWRKAPLTVKVGRQILSYGDERLVGGLDWTNTARVFDAVKLVYVPSPRLQVDFFASRVVNIEKEQVDTTASDDNFFGFYASLKPFRTQMDQILDTFLFIRNNQDASVVGERPGQRGELKEYTLGNRFKGKKWNWDYGTEYALQFGSRAHNDIAAWAFHQDLGYTFAKVPWTPRIYGEYNHASGDRNPSDGVFSSFDHLFPTNHNKYGFIDFVGWRNMNDWMLGASVKPHARLLCSADFHWFRLDAKESAWFNALGNVVRPANANADPNLGEEVDLLSTYKLTEHVNLMLGYSHFFAGPFVEDTGRSDDANFLYFQTVVNF